ncbi:phage late control D family protein [Paenibacillus arenilitoris]|uniref:Phage late control D family protein n=1 Tax=Paenibacillus arenilitoris TaxID=2772299 RepID=A0A927H3Q3_9BACL|nr:contractile injection system protein, VgrG/Pvc8 family [Paenibacillus arenilitoris]MBD2867586.1 phage late control D family protein [Paenibacillus arenilitoris]
MAPGNSFSSLEQKYDGFKAPEADIVIEGQIARQANMAVEWVDVELSTDAQADIARFAVSNGYVWSESRMQWIGSTIAVGKKLQVKLGYADKKTQVFDGIITGYTVDFPSDGSPTIVVTAMDRSFLLMKSSHSKVWNQMKDTDVVRQIAGDYGLSAEIDDTTVTKKTIEQIGISDYHFIRSLAIDNDRLFYVEGSKLYFKKPKTSGDPLISLKYGQSLMRFTLQVDGSSQASQVKVRGYDVDKMEAVEHVASSVTIIGSRPKSGPSVASQLSSKKVEIVYTQAASVDEATALAKAMLERLSRELVAGSGMSIGMPEFKPGELIKIEGLGSDNLDQLMRLTKIVHRLDAEDGYTTYFETEGNAI